MSGEGSVEGDYVLGGEGRGGWIGRALVRGLMGERKRGMGCVVWLVVAGCVCGEV